MKDFWDKLQIKNISTILESYINGFLEALPTLLIALIVFIIFWMISNLVRTAIEKFSARFTHDRSLQSLFGTLARVTIVLIGMLVAAALIFPGLKAGDLVGVLGLSSVAIGFAFKDIFQNFLAGILILTQRPFTIGDQIAKGDIEGTVNTITIRSTTIRTYDGQHVVVPNSELFTNAVTVRTAEALRRSTFTTGIAYSEDIEAAREVIHKAVEGCEEVVSDPAPQIYVVEHSSSSINFDLRYWTKPEIASVKRALDQVATAVKYALDEAEIEIPYPYRTLEFFDKTDYAEMAQNLSEEQLDTLSALGVGPGRRRDTSRSEGE